ncbi:MAG: thiol peroxidase [Ilumatobacteraceae bacterium]|jgi:thiol peroxidase|nr:thiol peroxidase [Ilumatobacteraceae bacterium]
MAQTSFGGNPVNTMGDVPAQGSNLPSFSLTNSTLAEVGNADFSGKRVVFNIFPSVDTPVCASSIRKFNELASSLDNTVVLCVSADLPFAQGRFCGSEGLTNVQNASSFRTDFGKTFGVGLSEGAFAGLLARAVIVADENGKVLHSELVSDIGQEPNYDAAVNALK